MSARNFWLNAEHVLAFGDALSQALRDKRREVDRPSVLVFDADVVLKTIIGLATGAELAKPLPKPENPTTVMRALLSLGRLGSISMLRPHLIEFHRTVRTLPVLSEEEHADAIRDHQQRLRREWALDQLESELIRRIRDAEATGNGFSVSDGIRRFGFAAIVRCELTWGGHWKARLHRLRDDLDFNPINKWDAFHPDGRRVEYFYEKISRIPHRRHLSANNIVDAAALDALAEWVEDVDEPFPLFYSETTALKTVLEEFTAEWGAGENFFRDELYMLVRSSFSALQLEQMPARPLRDPLDVAHLQAMSRVLTGVKNAPSDELQRVLAEAPGPGGRSLYDLIVEFYQLNLLEEALVEGVPRSIEETLPNLAAFLDEDRRQRLAAAAEATEARVLSALTAQLDYLTHWHDTVVAIMDRVERRAAAEAEGDDDFVKAAFRLDTDLGLARWNLHKTLGDPEGALDHIRTALTTSETRRHLMASRVAIVVADILRNDGAASMRATDLENLLVFIWFLRDGALYRLVFKAVRRRLAEREALVGLSLLDPILQVRDTIWRSEGTTTDVAIGATQAELDALKAVAASSDPSDMPSAELGLAHALYWAWQNLDEVVSAHRGSDAAPNVDDWAARAVNWARDSCACAMEAMNRLETMSLQWLFAVNHIAYVGLAAGVKDKELFPPGRTLRWYFERVEHAFWVQGERHFRFADTLAFDLLLAARSESAVGRRGEAVELLEGALELYAMGGSAHGDAEVGLHRQEIKRTLRELRTGADEVDTR